MIPEALLAAYRATRYVVRAPDREIEIRIDHCSAEMDQLLETGGVRHGFIITAWNPRSQRFDDTENRRRSALLESDLRQCQSPWLPTIAIAEDPSWSEEGMLVLGMSRDAARNLGKRYDQNAIVLVALRQPAQLDSLLT